MSIRQKAFNLCKAIPNLDSTQSVRDALGAIRNTTLEYLGHRQYAQTYGYLVIDSDRGELAKPPRSIQIEPLAAEHREVFTAYHAALAELNDRCMSIISSTYPSCTKQIWSPFTRFAPIELEPVAPVTFFPAAETESLVTAFHEHPLVTLLLETPEVATSIADPIAVSHSLLHLEADIKKALPGKLPDKLDFVIDNFAPNAPQWLECFNLLILLGIRASLSVLNQLLYSKILISRLPCLDEKNVINSGVYYFATGARKLLFQESVSMMFCEKEDIVITVGLPPVDDRPCFSRIERLGHAIPPMPGQPEYVELLEIDEHLNPYERILANFQHRMI